MLRQQPCKPVFIAYTQKDIDHDRVQVLKGRKLLSPKPGDTLVVKLLGGPNLPVFVDVAKNPDLVLDPLILPCYAFEIQEIAWLNERPHYVVRFYPQVILSFALYEGLLYIDQEPRNGCRSVAPSSTST